MTSEERDPYGKPLCEAGSKADEGKPPIFRGLLDYFPRACQEVALVSLRGAKKYSWKGWESVPGGVNRYKDAIARHLVAEGIEGEFDKETGLLHAAQVAWNALATLELILKWNPAQFNSDDERSPPQMENWRTAYGTNHTTSEMKLGLYESGNRPAKP